ncbi:hypothetical protein Cmtc_18940 [Cupriavidus sp. TKC]|uniref:hypothetical protein n=1 Tax=Cupriavidus sp. TKC TaxID=2880159 RepID=UPI0025A739CC|nr:hypothetical protein [Cupriavidus sp. TKC]GMG90674.1 hypothetical protein Cmtc_18940 [Cupriavidus sp. TKC]
MKDEIEQLIDWLLTNPINGERLHFAGAPEKYFMGLTRVMMQSQDGSLWTLTEGLKEGYQTESEMMENIRAAAKEAAEKASASAQQDEREAEWLTSKWCTVCKGATCLPGMHGLSEAVKQHVIAEFLQCTGQYVTNNASREAAIADAISKLPARTFEQAWAEKERQGYKYGNDALECVRMGWDMACASKPHAAQQVQANAGAVPFDIQDYEAFHADMDHQGVPRKTKFGVQLSAFGRAQYFAAMSRDTENGNV